MVSFPLVYVGQYVPSLDEAASGGRIRSHYLLQALRSFNPETESLTLANRSLNLRALRLIWRRRSALWFEYPAPLQGEILASVLALLPWTTLYVDVHDLPEQQHYALSGRNLPRARGYITAMLQKYLFWRSTALMLASPGLREFLDATTLQKTLDLPNGCTLSQTQTQPPILPPATTKRRLLYAGGITAGRDLEKMLRALGESELWELVVVGFGDEQVITRLSRMPNVRFLGRLPYPRVLRLLQEVDAVVIPYPHGPYYDRALPVKLLDSLASSRPVIMTKLSYAQTFVLAIGLQENVVFVDELTEESLLRSLRTVAELKIDDERTRRAMSEHTWEANARRVLPKVFHAD